MAGDGGMNLRFQTDVATPVEYLHSAVKRSADAPKAIMRSGVLSVQAEGEPDQSGLRKPPHRIPCYQRRG